MIDGAVSLFSDCLGLRPFMFDGVEVRGVRGEVFEGVAGVAQGILNVGSFMESGVIQDNHGGWRELRQEDVLNPGEEDIGVDAAFK